MVRLERTFYGFWLLLLACVQPQNFTQVKATFLLSHVCVVFLETFEICAVFINKHIYQIHNCHTVLVTVLVLKPDSHMFAMIHDPPSPVLSRVAKKIAPFLNCQMFFLGRWVKKQSYHKYQMANLTRQQGNSILVSRNVFKLRFFKHVASHGNGKETFSWAVDLFQWLIGWAMKVL